MKNLGKSLIGISLECRSSGETDDLTRRHVSSERNEIEKCLKIADMDGDFNFKVLGACMYDYYLNNKYFLLYRSAFAFGRRRGEILSYLERGPDSKEIDLQSLCRAGGDSKPLSTLKAVEYFVRLYPHRLKNFRDYLTREEYNDIRLTL